MSLVIAGARAVLLALLAAAALARAPARPGAAGVHLGANGAIQHVIVIAFDNTHLDDMRQMPHLESFISGGTLFTNDHSVLQSHTHADFVSIATGDYPDRTGIPDQYFLDGGRRTSFGYWLSRTAIGQPLIFAPPPWQAFNRRGLAVAGIGWGDMELERAAEVAQQHVSLQPSDRTPADYLGVALYRADGSVTFGTPNLPNLFQAPRWDDPTRPLGAFPSSPVWGGSDAWWPLAATFELQRAGTPVTFTYITDAHDSRKVGAYADRLRAYDDAFAMFFQRLAAAGIDRSNTLFVFTTDEGDYYDAGGDQGTSLASWLANNPIYRSNLSNLQILSDPAPFVYMKNRGAGEAILDHTLASLRAVPGWQYIADAIALRGLHVSSLDDPARNPAFVVYGKPNIFYSGRRGSTGFSANPSFLWNHGTVGSDITTTWLALAGPGIKSGQTLDTWVDHTDVMPTIDLLLGLPPRASDGRALLEAIDDATLPAGTVAARATLSTLGGLLKQLNAPLGSFGIQLLQQSTRAALAAGTSAGSAMDATMQDEIARRDTLVARIQVVLDAALGGAPTSAGTIRSLTSEAKALLPAP